MADNDIFRKYVRKEFQNASRAVTKHHDIARAVAEAMVGLDQIIGLWTPMVTKRAREIHEIATSPDLHSGSCDERLDEIGYLGDSSAEEITKIIGRFAHQEVTRKNPVPADFGEFFTLAAAEFVTGLVFPRIAIHRMAEEHGWEIGEIITAANQFQRELGQNPEFRLRVSRFIHSPIQKPREGIRRRTLSQEALLSIPILEIVG